jgi:hypothetical protein
MCGKVYEMVESTTFIIEIEFCAIIRKHLKPLVIERLTSNMNLKGFKVYLMFLRQ